MAKPENQFRSSVHAYFAWQDLHHEKMSNPYRAGGADDWYSGKGKGSKDLWIEWKYVDLPVRDETVIDLVSGKKPPITHLQQLWLADRYAEGRNVWVGVGSAKGGILLKDLDWLKPLSAGQFRARLQSRRELADHIVHFVRGTLAHQLRAAVHDRARDDSHLPHRIDHNTASVPRATRTGRKTRA